MLPSDDFLLLYGYLCSRCHKIAVSHGKDNLLPVGLASKRLRNGEYNEQKTRVIDSCK